MRTFGSIRKLPSGRFQARYKLKIGPATRTFNAPGTFRTKREAAQWLDQQSADISRGERKPHTYHQSGTKASNPLLRDYAQTWLQKLEERDVSPNTMRSYLSTLRCHILPKLGEYELRAITKPILNNWYETTAVNSSGAKRNAYRTLSSLLNAAVDDDLIPSSPLHIKGALAKPKTRNEARERVASVKQVEQIASLMPEQMGIAVFLAAWAGLRWNEIAALRRKHIDLESGVIRVRAGVKRKPNGGLVEGPPKSALGVRDIPLAPVLRERLEAHLDKHVDSRPEALIVYSSAGRDRFLSNKSLHTRYDRAVSQVGLDGFGFHQLRATCATWLMRSGATPAEIQAILGHSDWATSQLYQRASKERLRQVMNSLSD